MHDLLARAAGALDLKLPALARAADFSERQIKEARLSFRKRLGDNHGLDIVVCGSMARREMSSASDFDYLVVAHGLVEDASRLRSFRAACDDWRDQHGIEPPGSTGIFGIVVSGAELVEQIGLEFDTNASLTRRVLLMEEGVSVLAPRLHRQFVEVILGRYLYEDHSDTSGSPRFLLNDMTRYWRTIAVDYQAKVWRDLSVDGWGAALPQAADLAQADLRQRARRSVSGGDRGAVRRARFPDGAVRRRSGPRTGGAARRRARGR